MMAGSPEKKSPWGNVAAVEASTSLSEVMSEQLATALLEKEEKQEQREQSRKEMDDAAFAAALEMTSGGGGGNDEPAAAEEYDAVDDACKDDLLIAQMLQMQFDSQYDSTIANEERVRNGTSKVRVSYEKYKVIPDHHLWEDSDDEDPDLAEYLSMDERLRDWDCYEAADKEVGAAAAIPRCGYKKSPNGEMITKHDKETNERENGKKIMSIPVGIKTGDGGGIGMQIDNKIFNSLKNFAMKEAKRRDGRINDKTDKSTAEQAVDPATRLLLFKMVNSGVLETVNGVISTGKEAVIIHAEGGPGPEPTTTNSAAEPMNVPKECVLKVFKTTLNEFKTRERYIKDDYRFRSRFSKQNPRKIIHMWAEKEMRNLVKMARCGINVPHAVLLKKHVLLMSFVGRDGVPAPKLKDVRFSEYAELELAYDEVAEMMAKLYNECRLVHADLSEYNILWHDGHPWFIDVSQSVEPNHPHGLEWLYRDCTNVATFFERRGLLNGKSPWRMFTDITGLPFDDGEKFPETEAEILARILDFEKREEILSLGCGFRREVGDLDDEYENRGNVFVEDDAVAAGGGYPFSAKHYPFDYCWERAQESKGKDPAKSSPRPIPGHAKTKGGKGARAPKSPSSGGAAAAMSKSPKSPKSGASLASMTSLELRELKDELQAEAEAPNEESAKKVTFKDGPDAEE